MSSQRKWGLDHYKMSESIKSSRLYCNAMTKQDKSHTWIMSAVTKNIVDTTSKLVRIQRLVLANFITARSNG